MSRPKGDDMETWVRRYDEEVRRANLRELERDALQAKVERLEAALRPFARFAAPGEGTEPRVEAREDGDGGRWTEFGVGCYSDRIVDWFGPSDFFAARTALTDTAPNALSVSDQSQEASHG